MRRTNQGFSLIELLVVLTILGALAAGGTVFIRIAARNKARTLTSQRLFAIATGLEEVKDALGYYPPTLTTDLKSPDGKDKPGEKVGLPNDTNVGIETVYIAFKLNGVNPDLQGLGDGAIGNTDNDKVAELVGQLQVTDMFEYVDFWGNPFVYFSSKDYADVSAFESYVKAGDGSTAVKVKPHKSGKEGVFKEKNRFQLFSMGPDGEPNTPDDLGWAMD
jgi:prepilin-type N-terminal cleavage/methylation domain-containing protein